MLPIGFELDDPSSLMLSHDEGHCKCSSHGCWCRGMDDNVPSKDIKFKGGHKLQYLFRNTLIPKRNSMFTIDLRNTKYVSKS